MLLLILILLLVFGLPNWGYAQNWGYGPTGVILVILLVLLLTGYH